MLYTIGHTDSYLQYFSEYKIPKKLGKCILEDGTDYPGGIVFKTSQEANDYLMKNNLINFSIFGLNAEWDNHTYLYNNGYHALLLDTELILLS